ncbi:MAG: alkaline phosphatase family protein [Anaerolineaceae bacterium]
MKPILRFVFVLVLCLALNIGSYSLAMQLLANMYDYRSPLLASPPIPGQSLGSPIARQVVFVIVDGLRYDTFIKSDVMPNLSQLRSIGAYAKMHSRIPTYSSPGYGVLLTGAWPEISDAPPFNPAYEDIHTISQDNLFSSAHRLGLKTGISAFYWFEKLIPQDSIDGSFYTSEEDQKADREVVDAALPWLSSGQYQLVLIHLDQVDYAGHHEGGPKSKNWDAAAKRADDLIGEILKKMDLKQDIILVVSDHGHIDSGGHGGQEDILRLEPFLLAGKGIQQGEIDGVQMADVAPTLAAILGLNVPASSQGQARFEWIKGLSSDTVSNLAYETSKQQSQLLQKYAVAIGAKLNMNDTIVDAQKTVSDYQSTFEQIRQTKINRQRTLRIGIGILCLVIIGFVLFRWKFFNAGWLFFGAIIYTILFHAYYWLLGARHYSYSIANTELSLILPNGLAALIILIMIWIFFTWRNKSATSGIEMATFSGLLVLVIAFVTFLPVAAHWVWDGMFATWTLPNFGLHFLAMISLIQILFLGIGGLFLIGLSFWFRSRNKLEKV